MASAFIAIGKGISAAFSTVSSTFMGGGAAAGAAGGGAATTATATTGMSGLSLLSSALSAGSAISSIASANASAAAIQAQAEEQAAQIQTQAAQSKARDAQERATLAKEYESIVAEQKAVQFAAGLNPGVGTPAKIRTATRKIAEQNLSVSRENTRSRQAVARLQTRSLFKSANARSASVRAQGYGSALKTGINALQLVG